MPDKYYIDGNGNIRVVPEGKEQKFITKYPGSREATNKELSDFENKRAEMQSSTQRESNIQNGQGGSTAKTPTNKPLNGQNTSFVPNQFNFNVPNYAEEFAKNKPQIDLRQTDNTPTKIFSGNSPFAKKSFNESIEKAGQDYRQTRAQDTDYIIQSAIDEHESYKKWIDEVNRNPEMSDSVKKGLNDWYNQNFRDTNNATDDVRIPSLVRDYLESNKRTVPTSVWVQGSSMFGGGSYAEGTKQENTPEQMAMIADFLVNSPKGRLIMEDEKLYLKRLDDSIDELEKDIRETSTKRREITPKTIRMRDYLRMPKWEKEKFNKEREAIRADIEKQYPFGDLMNSENQLNELKKLREAYNDGDKGAIKQLLKEFGRRLPYDLANAGSLGTIGLTDQSMLSDALDNPKNVLTRKGYNLVNEYQQAHELDRSIAQDIARGTTQTLPFITQFVATGGVTSAAGKSLLSGASKIGLNAEKLATIGSGIDKTSRLGKGLTSTGNIAKVAATDVLDAGARSLIMPNTYADAYARSIDNPGSYLDNLTHSWFVNTIENYSEKFGAHLPGIGFKNPKLKRIMDQTGIQGFPEEFAEEQIGTILNAAFNTGEAEWSDLVDPRNQLITAGTIGLLQVPYASMSAGGYAAGKYRDIKQKRSIRKGYNSNLVNMNNVFGEESEALISTINQIIESDNSEGVGINSFIANVADDTELTDKEKDAVFKYTMSYVPYSALNQSKQEQVQEVEQQVTQAVEENANPEMNAVVSATIAGVEGPMQIVSGNIVQREDGSIDREASDKQIFYVDAEGNRQVTSIDFVENIEENIPTQDAIAQLTEAETANIISQQENEEVREYTPGEIVTADIYGNGVPFTGEITEVTEEGNYIIVGIQSGQRAEIQPSQIINQDNIQGVDNGSLVQYRNEKGEIVQGEVLDAHGLRPQGMMDIDGNVIPIADVIGLVEEEEQLPPPPADMMIGENGPVPYNQNVSNSQDSTQGVQQNEQSVTTSPSEQNNLSYIEQIPQNESGSLLFEQVPVETTIGALNEVYSDTAELSGVVDATISNIGKQIEKAKSPKPTGDITKDIANKQKANQQIEELNNRLSYWQDVRNSIQQSKPIEQRVTEQLTGEETPTIKLDNERKPRTVNRNTPFQRRLNAVEENVHSIRDRILFGIASGAYKFRWNDKGVSMGLARELGLSGSEAERKARIGLLSNNGYTPSTLAHRIWEETGGELNDNDIRSEVINVLNSVSSRKQALETLENNAGITEEQYQQQQTEASEYELKLRAQEEANLLAIIEQQSNETLLSLEEEALSLGATSEQLQDVQTSTDFIDLIEQLQDGQQEQTSNEGRSETETSNNNSEGNETDSTQRAVGERSRSEESTGDSRQDSDSTGNGINLSPEEQRVVNEATAQIDAEIAEAQKELTTQQKELSSARKRLGKAQADTQSNLFGSEQQSTLFDVPADLSKENAVDNILSPIQQQIDAAQTNLDTLTNSRDARIQEALDNYRKQGNLLDEIARAEAETDTNPTEAQKEAGNYKKGKVTIQGFNISIEQPQGSVRSGVDAYEPQIGQPFAKESELKATEEKVEDLNAQMEVELKQIEEAESKEDVEAIDIDGIVEKNTDDNPEDDPTPPSGGRRQASSSGNFQSIPAEKFDRLVDKLTQTGLAVDVVLNEDIRNNPELQDAEGNVYGYVTPEGVVHLDATRMNANTPIHEFGHLWNSFTKENDTALYNRGVELIKQSPYWERVNNNSDYAQLSETEKADEALAMAIGDKGEAITNRSIKQQFVDWLSEVWQSIKRAFGINTNVSLADMTLSDFTDRAVQDLLRGEMLTDTSVQSEETRMQSVNDLADATNSTMTEEVRNQLDSRIKNFRFRIREAWEDRHLAVKEFLDTLHKNGVDIAEYNDYYKQATHINGKIDAQLEHYNEKFQKPLNKAISDLEKAGFDYRAIENYAILKHGLERNEWMRQDAINKYKEQNPDATEEQISRFEAKLPDDYSGITAVEEEVGKHAEWYINDFEEKAGKKLTDNFWKKVKDTTQYSISKQLEGGLIDKKTFDDLTNRYDYYIPLRGHDAEVAEDRWDYSPNMGTYFVAPLIKAKGRKTRSESPFAYIFSMAQSSINSANRNWLNQTMLRLARKDTTGLMGVSQSWYVMDGMNADGVPTYTVQSPTFSENPEQYRENIEEFEERMQKLAEQDLARPSGSKLNIGGMFIKRNQADQHEVHVWQNGKEYTVYINANPAVARAINGVNAKDLHKDLRFIAKVSRQMAANFTTRNPIFVATNFSRDYIFASSILPVKEDAKYAVQFQRNIPRSAGALQRYIRGKADLSKKQDQYVIEYIMNGAKTGFSHIVELDKIQKRIEREIKNGESKNVFRSFLDALEGCNEFAENLSRLSVYITSREQGRSITQSISDAKEVTVNFNRSGTGGYGAAWFRSLYLFVNAGIQALSNFAKVAQKNKGKTALLISGYAMTGFLMPMLTALIGGDDGLDEYMKLSDWERQNNLCLYTGSGFIKIPLPHELRVFHAMGDNIYQAAFGRKDTTETLLDVTMSFSDLIPANPMGAIQGSWADIMPDATKPFFQLQANRNFTGSRIVNEWADPNKPGYLRVRTNKKGEPYAPAFLVKLGESLDAATGGDGVEKGLISFNPDEVNHILRGYFGGLYTIGTQVVTIGDKVYELADTGEFKLKVRETPLKTFYTSESDLMTTSSGLNSKYFKISDDMQETRRKIKGYQEQALNGDLTTEEFAAKIGKFAPDIEKYKRLYPYMKQIKKYESALKDLDGEDQKEAERIIADMKKQVIEINSIK